MPSFLGIDLSKETFHALLLGDRADAKKVFPNTPKGFEQLTTWLKESAHRRGALLHGGDRRVLGSARVVPSWPRPTRQRGQPGSHQGVCAE
jgi:transposase